MALYDWMAQFPDTVLQERSARRIEEAVDTAREFEEKFDLAAIRKHGPPAAQTGNWPNEQLASPSNLSRLRRRLLLEEIHAAAPMRFVICGGVTGKPDFSRFDLIATRTRRLVNCAVLHESEPVEQGLARLLDPLGLYARECSAVTVVDAKQFVRLSQHPARLDPRLSEIEYAVCASRSDGLYWHRATDVRFEVRPLARTVREALAAARQIGHDFAVVTDRELGRDGREEYITALDPTRSPYLVARPVVPDAADHPRPEELRERVHALAEMSLWARRQQAAGEIASSLIARFKPSTAPPAESLALATAALEACRAAV